VFDIGFWELLIIGVVLLLVMGPERLPEVAKQAAFILRKTRQSMYRLRSEMRSELGDLDGGHFADLKNAHREITDFKNDVKQMGRDLADAHDEPKAYDSSNKSITGAEDASKDDSITATQSAKTADKPSEKVKKKRTKKASKKRAKKSSNKTTDQDLN